MKISSGFLFALGACLVGGTLGISPARAAQISVISFPNKLILSTNDNRIIAFIVEKDGVRIPEAQIKAEITSGGGTLDISSCKTDESGQCLFSFTAPDFLEKGTIEATASMAGAEDGKVSVDVDVVGAPTLSGSGWQCDGDAAIYAQIQETIICSDACSLDKDCAQSKCPAGGEIYCHSAQEACVCGGVEMVKGADTKAEAAAGTTASAASEDTTDKSTGPIAIFSLTIGALAYIIIHRRRKIKNI